MLSRSIVARLSSRLPEAGIRYLETRGHRTAMSQLDQIVGGPRPIVVGPWISEVGFELLYWLPLLTWLRDERGVRPEEVVAISRGGAGCWYGNVAGQTVELFDLVEPQDLLHWRGERVAAGTEKQAKPTPHERDLVSAARRELAIGDAGWLHPSIMYRLFNHAWRCGGDAASLLGYLSFEPLPIVPVSLPDLPAHYVVVKAYTSRVFPDTPGNRLLLRGLVAALAERMPVVLLQTPTQMDDHVDLPPDIEGLLDPGPWLDPSRNLAIQTEIVRRSSALLTTYGGFSYLGAYLGVPTTAFYSRPDFNPLHVDVVSRMLESLGIDPPFYSVRSISDIDPAALADHAVAVRK